MEKKLQSPHICVDVEANGNIQGFHSMVSFGMVVVEPGLSRTFYRKLRPINDAYIPEAIAVSGFTFQETLAFDDPMIAMQEAADWVKANVKGRPIFWSDNPAYDFGWINWYFHTFINNNPFGWSGRRIGDVYSGMMKDGRAKWKHLRDTTHTHNALDDAKGNAEVLLKIKNMGFKM